MDGLHHINNRTIEPSFFK